MASEGSRDQMIFVQPRLDRLSNLPGELINNILKLVPIRDAVRTSVLSWDWRYKWMTIPELIFNACPILPSRSSERQTYNKLVDIINHVVFLHKGVLDKFEMHMHMKSSYKHVDRWILLLERKFVKEVLLEFSGVDRYNIPSSLFLCQSLQQLKLHHCILKSLFRTKGFDSLVDLDLNGVTLTMETIANLISNSRQLQKLTLMNCDGFHRLYICAPNLRIFYFNGPCGDIYFDNCPKLIDAYIGLLPVLSGSLPPNFLGKSTKRLELVLAGVHRVEKLFISEHFMEILAACVAPKKLHTTYHHLRDLSLVMKNLANSKEFLTAICLFRSSPYMQKLTIISSSTEQSGLLTEDEFQNACLNREELIFPELKTVTLCGFKGMNHELIFVKFILMNAGKLRTMSITWDATVEVGFCRAHILQKMMEFQRASPTAVVKFLV
ncbi:F-box/FBD/LRR-repeat protein [Thalictrum thalictroides]|uniref:F-box/FBD/LRR-repeat protein n=1 Tax=Thalictrum thalictroides TaxID=46969 RepID=A0A7J6WM37_THATH|nr:F-box/FBD/LRR-repeat protein [Thalictrum thalictroides]